MPSYKYKAVDREGRTLSGVAVAESESDLEQQLSHSERLLISAAPTARVAWALAPRLSRKELIAFTAQMGVIAGSGIPLLDGLEDIGAHAGGDLKRIVDDLVAQLRAGKLLSAAMESNSRVFGTLYVSAVRSGEETGALDQALVRLVSYLEWEEEIASRARQAMAYPLILTALLGTVLAILVIFVLPRFGAIFSQKGFPLPLPTRMLLAAAAAVRSYWPAILAGVVALAVLPNVLSLGARGRLALHRVKIKLPVLGTLLRKIAVSRFAHTLAATLGAGVDIISSIRLAGAATGNAYFARSAARVADGVSTGMDLSAALKRSGLFPPLLVRMAAVGEKTGALSSMLDKASHFYDREVRLSVSAMITICETAVTLAMGMAVAMVALSVFLPLYRMMALIRR